MASHLPQATIHAQVLRRILDACPIDTASRRRLLTDENLSVGALDGVGAVVPLRSYLRIFDRLARDLDRPTLGLQLSAALGPDLVGAIGFLFLNSPTLEAALTAYSQAVFSIQEATLLSFDKIPEPTVSYAITDESQHPRRQDVEFSLGHVNALIRQYLGPGYAPLEVHLEHARSGSLTTYEAAFGCPVYFEQPRNALILNPADIQRSSIAADPGLAVILRHYLQLVDRRDQVPDNWTGRVRDAIAGSLDPAASQIGAIAGRLGLGIDALQRRLASEGTSFRTLALQKRMTMAQRHLLDTTLPIASIAHLVGYSETAAFSRTFKVYCGMTPRDYRFRRPK